MTQVPVLSLLLSSNLKYSGNEKINIQEYAENYEQKFKSTAKEKEKVI